MKTAIAVLTVLASVGQASAALTRTQYFHVAQAWKQNGRELIHCGKIGNYKVASTLQQTAQGNLAISPAVEICGATLRFIANDLEKPAVLNVTTTGSKQALTLQQFPLLGEGVIYQFLAKDGVLVTVELAPFEPGQAVVESIRPE